MKRFVEAELIRAIAVKNHTSAETLALRKRTEIEPNLEKIKDVSRKAMRESFINPKTSLVKNHDAL